MPLINPQSAAEWAQHYTGGYSRSNPALVIGFQIDVPKLVTALNLVAGQQLVIMGAGFGFLGDAFSRMGLGPLTCCDINPYIQAQKGVESERPVLNEDGLMMASRNRILATLPNGKADLVISNDAMPWLSDSECSNAATQFRRMAPVAHWISAIGDAGPYIIPAKGNWKTLPQWKTLLTPDRVVQRGTDRVL